jgi:hypothetical protein
MARTKTSTVVDCSKAVKIEGMATPELTKALGEAFNKIIIREFGQYLAPPPIITPTGILPLDYLLGGGIVSSKPVMISSTPESGKSTFCFQFSKIFQDTHTNGVIVYLDIEGAGNAAENKQEILGQISRIETFGLKSDTFQYQPVILDINGVFDLLEKLAQVKQAFEEKLEKEFYVLLIWDSLSATRCSKTDSTEDVNKIIGFKARELTFKLDKYLPVVAFKKFTFIIVDQVRANLKNVIDGPYVPKEKTVGVFNDYRAATSINSLNHLTGQWLYLSKKKVIDFSDGYGIDGWELVVQIEKNKYAPSQCAITCVFDKNTGLNKFWTHFKFMSELCSTEFKIYKKSEKLLPYPLCLKQSGAYYYLKVVDPQNLKNVLYTSDTFYKKNAKKLYDSDDIFRQWFDYAINTSSYLRIIEGLFKHKEMDEDEDIEVVTDGTVDEFIDSALTDVEPSCELDISDNEMSEMFKPSEEVTENFF